MFGDVVAMCREIVAEIASEFAHEPMRVLAEVVQFALLAGAAWVVMFGFGKRKGFVANMLSERQSAIARRVERATHADEALADAKREAASLARDGRAQARDIVARAKQESSELEAAARAETDADCARIEERAEAALSTERQEVQLELREKLVDLVSSATRTILNEKLTVSEQRRLIEAAVSGSVAASGTAHREARVAARDTVSKGA